MYPLHSRGGDVHKSPTASFRYLFHAKISSVEYSLSRYRKFNVYCKPIYTPPTTTTTIAHRVFRSKRAKGPHGEIVLFPGSPDPGGGCEGSSSPKFVYLGNFRVGLVCNDRIGSSLAVGRGFGLMGIRPIRNALENMTHVLSCSDELFG